MSERSDDARIRRVRRAIADRRQAIPAFDTAVERSRTGSGRRTF